MIRALLEDTSVTCVYAFMTGKSQALYEELFRAVDNKFDPSVTFLVRMSVVGAVSTI